MNRLVRIFCFFLVNMASLVVAQAPGVGLYAFGSFDSRGFDTINLGNLNTHFAIPIVAKPGRGVNFTYSIVYDGLVWSSITVSGVQQWAPDSSFGFHNQFGSGITGYLTYSQTLPGEVDPACPFVNGRPADGIRYSNYVYHDQLGRGHAINYVLDLCGTGPIKTGNGSSSDGFSFDGTEVHDSTGKVINAPSNPTTVASTNGNITDTNGNSIVNNGNGTFTDTLGVTALTIGGSGSASSPLTLSYPVVLQSNSATTATATVYYKTYAVETKFQCSGISEYGGTTDLMDHITLPDAVGSTYSFTYETTPGVSGAVTGRLASITLPTGGTINYSYSGGGCSGSSGINSDGTVGSLTRTTTDGSRIYTRSTINSNATSTTAQDEKRNQSVYNFTIANGLFYETRRQIYQGAVGGLALMTRWTCYNGVQPACDGATVTPPFSQTIAVFSYNGGPQDSLVNTYDASGMLTRSSEGWWGQTPMQTQTTSYNLLEEPLSASTTDGSGNLVAQTTYGYDETSPTATSGIPQHAAVTGTRGNQTSSHVTTGSSTMNTATAYYDTGVPYASTAPDGGVTGYGYDSTQTFVFQNYLPTPSSGVLLTTSASYDLQSGALTSVTGLNSGQTAQVTQYDPLLRPLSISLPNGGQISNTIFSVLDTGISQTMGNGQSANVRTLVDAYGRKSRVAVLNGQSSNPWYQTDYCYDATGLLQFQSLPYQGGGWGTPKQCSGSGTSYVYDALGRVTSTANADGTAYRQYNGRAVETTDVNGVQRITQYDLLGRILSVCEISSSTLAGVASSPCSNVDISGTGFQTNYSYNLQNHATTITQGAQTRVFQTDAAGRTIYTSEPERGVTTYSYVYNATSGPCAGASLCVTRTRPQANQTNQGVLTTTTTQYDSLGRPLNISYSDGTPAKAFSYDQSTAFGGGGVSLGASKGMLTGIGVSFGSNYALAAYSYDVMGNVIWSDQCLPSSCGVPNTDKILQYTYDLAGNMTSVSDGYSYTASYTYSPASEVTGIQSSMSGSTYPSSLISSVQNGPTGTVSYLFGNGLSQSNVYDSMGRQNGGWVCYGSPVPACPSQAYGTWEAFKGSRVIAIADNVIGQGNTFGYDEFNRLTSTSLSNGAQTFSYTYDRYGNRWTQNAPQGGPAPQYSFNTNPSNNQNLQFLYDAAGNLMNDGFCSYTYDAEGNVVQVTGCSTATYYYNALNQRVRADQGSTSREYVYNLAGQRTSIWDGNTRSQIQGQYYWGARPVAFYTGGSLHFQHQDLLGTERVQTSYNGSNEASYASLPWGDAYSTNGTDDDPYHFALLDHDSESSTEHAQFRQYSSTQGRWMSPDRYDGSYDAGNPQSFNRYAYVLNNPLAAADPSGQMIEQDGGCAFYDCSGGSGVGDGGGGTGYDLNGFATSASTAQWLISIGGATVCPSNLICNGFGNSGVYIQTNMANYGITYNVWNQPSLTDGTISYGMNYNSTLVSWGALGTTPPSLQSLSFAGPNGAASNNTKSPKTAFAGSLSFPIGPAISGSIPVAVTNNATCLGLGIGVGSKGWGANGGIVTTAANNIVDVLEGASVSFAAQSGFFGVQWSHNNSGIAAGNSVGIPGISLTVSYSVCF